MEPLYIPHWNCITYDYRRIVAYMIQYVNHIETNFLQDTRVTNMESKMKLLFIVSCLITISGASHASEFPPGFIQDHSYISRDQKFIQALKAQHEHSSDIHQYVRNDEEAAFERVAIEQYVAIPKREKYTGR